jgi:hypothetical protein
MPDLGQNLAEIVVWRAAKKSVGESDLISAHAD